ncbi:hypothetical protein D9756_000717 [Leucocoprinus leucothites]|uniref:Phospholipid/glycerol acyltransferase domain-containing protein n=1 Tax=Leucocoprinus leucothites TaxID=201217 RepID=A0A8H5GFR6_9AGAR|nr:hypothetical protein D9756_000717 [Leucoagaricus leucothites]
MALLRSTLGPLPARRMRSVAVRRSRVRRQLQVALCLGLMEKFSAYRDPGTGIQPFSVPLPPTSTTGPLQAITRVLGFGLGVFRTAIICSIALLYLTLVEILCLVLVPIPPLHRAITRVFTFVLAKLALWTLGIIWVPVETITKKKIGRNAHRNEPWNPNAGDLIISNWASWIEVLWLAARCNPVFVLPVPESIPKFEDTVHQPMPVTNRPGRATGTGSANIQSIQKHSAVPVVPIKGFRRVSLLRMICLAGRVPPFFKDESGTSSLDEIRKSAGRPVVVFPECTTSNGRGLLRFANVFNEEVPVKGYQVFIMCVRYDPPTLYTPTLTRPVGIPGPAFLNPLSHIFEIASSVVPLTVSIRLLPPSESPGSQLFLASDYVKGGSGEDQLAESSASLISQIGRLKRTGLGWEDKASFFHYRNLKFV